MRCCGKRSSRLHDALVLSALDPFKAATETRATNHAPRALSATAADHKAWEDALWGEPVATLHDDWLLHMEERQRTA